MTELRFDNQVAFVTGGAVGLGRAYAILLAERGAKVVVNGNYRASGIGPEADVVAEIRAKGGEAIGVNGSVSDEAAVQRMVAKTIETYGKLDILINNAGTASSEVLIQNAPDDVTEAQLDVHLRGHLRMARAAWPHLAKSGNGRLVNTGSAVTFGYECPDGWDGAYTVAKSALYGVTRQMAGAGAEFGIKVNMIMPWANTPLVERLLGHTPFGRWQREKLDPSKVAAAVAYLVHEDCPVTGQFISAAGGRITRVLFASPPGYFNADITPEDVRDNWAAIFGDVDAHGNIRGMFEVTGQQLEFAKIKECVGDIV
jgi:NAD(P)-dependent dehydrogenase (short-subunit alcohol dehydrogenase family)